MKKLLVLVLIAILLCLSSCSQTVKKEESEPVNGESPNTAVTAVTESESEAEATAVEASSDEPENSEVTSENNNIQKTEKPIETPAAPPAEQVVSSSVPDRTKIGFGYVPNSENKQVSIGQKYETLMNKYGGFFIDRANTKNIYLTMDEGYENGYTAQILDTLKEKGVQCAFFVTQPYAEKNPDLIRRMIDEGHILGNHSVNHKSMPTLTDEEALNEITGLHSYIRDNFGYTMKYFRPPMGEYSESSLSVTQSAGYRSVFWSFAYRDWETDNFKGQDYAVSSVNNGIHNGCVMLLHAVSKDNADGLGEIIDSLREKGYIFASLDNIK